MISNENPILWWRICQLEIPKLLVYVASSSLRLSRWKRRAKSPTNLQYVWLKVQSLEIQRIRVSIESLSMRHPIEKCRTISPIILAQSSVARNPEISRINQVFKSASSRRETSCKISNKSPVLKYNVPSTVPQKFPSHPMQEL